MSMMCISEKPERARVLRSSHPIPPAPTMRTFASLITEEEEDEAIEIEIEIKG
jgi:hypothetical protein